MCVLRRNNACGKVDIAATIDGVIESIACRPGESVSAGQAIILLQHDKALANKILATKELEKAMSLARDSASLVTANAQLAKAEANYKATQSLRQRSEIELFRLEMTLREAEANVAFTKSKQEQNEIDVEIKKSQLRLAEIEYNACTVKSPMMGIVSDQFKHSGEYVRAGEPIVQVLQMSELVLRIELNLQQFPPHSLADFDAVAEIQDVLGAPLSLEHISVERTSPNNIDSQSYFAYAAIQNTKSTDRKGVEHWQLRPGMAAKIILKPRVNQRNQSCRSR